MNHNYREQAIDLLKEKLPNLNLQRHSLAVESIMRSLAEKFNESVEEWSLAGLLHDVDYEETQKDLSQHSLLAAEWLEKRHFPPSVVNAVKVHNDMHGLAQETSMEKWLVCADALSGILVATALMLPAKARDLTVERVKKKIKDKAFARGVKREEIMRCEELGLPIDDFIAISIQSIQSIASDLGI
jgi:putative nucleotidyltransferase with HDIG domain